MTFARRVYERKPQPLYRPVECRASYAPPPPAAPIAKTPRREITHLLAMARGMPCLFALPGVCNRDPATTVAAHSNWA